MQLPLQMVSGDGGAQGALAPAWGDGGLLEESQTGRGQREEVVGE